MRIHIDLAPKPQVSLSEMSIFPGFCPRCNAQGVKVEGTNITCASGHVYTDADREFYQWRFCPQPGCDGRCYSTERRMNGNSVCEHGHTYPTAEFKRVVLPENREAFAFCPECNGHVEMREKRINGNDVCCNKHTFPSANALKFPIGGFCRTAENLLSNKMKP